MKWGLGRVLLVEDLFPWACALICPLVPGEAKIKLAVFASAQRAREQAGREIVSLLLHC